MTQEFFSPEMQALGKKSRRLGWLGMGFLFMWACSMTPFSDLVNSRSTMNQIMGYVGQLLITACGIGLFLHESELDSTAKALDERLRHAEEAARYWKQQSEAWQHQHDAIKIEAVELRLQTADMTKVLKFHEKYALAVIPRPPHS